MKGLEYKKIILVLVTAIMTTGGLFTIQTFAQAPAADSYEYTLLAPLPCVGGNCGVQAEKTSLEKYLPGVFKLAIGLSAAFAVLMIVIGGFQYMSSDAIMKKEDGRKRITNSIYGLFLVIGAWLILNTINPALLNINLEISPAVTKPTVELGGELSAGTGRVLPGYTLTPEQVTLNNRMREDLEKNYGVNVSGGPCTSGGTTDCVNLVGMPDTTFRGVTDLKKACSNCNITITGGTEGGHASHGLNLPPIDLGFDNNLEKYILGNQVTQPQTTARGMIYTSKVGNRNATFLKESNHWHVVFQ